MFPCDWWITQPHCLGFCLETDSSKEASSLHFGSWWLWTLLQVSCGISPWLLSQVSRWSVHLDTYLETAAKIICFRICHCSHCCWAHMCWCRYALISDLIFLKLTEGPHSSQMPAGASSIRQTLNYVLQVHLALLCRRRFSHGWGGIWDPWTPVKLELRVNTWILVLFIILYNKICREHHSM